MDTVPNRQGKAYDEFLVPLLLEPLLQLLDGRLCLLQLSLCRRQLVLNFRYALLGESSGKP